MRQRNYVRRRIVVATGFALSFLAALYLPFTLLAPLPAAFATSVAPSGPDNSPVDIAWPSFGSSAVGAVGFPGVLESRGTQTPRPIASISKIVTSLVVLDRKPLLPDAAGPSITMTAADTALYQHYLGRNGRVRPVWTGLVLTQRQLLEVVLITSANNYAESLATWAFGSVPRFLEAAELWLDDHGLRDTTITEPTGMDPRNTSTTADLVELAKIALAEPVISEIVSTKSLTLPPFGTIVNSNELLAVDGVVGIKTGTLDDAGACLLFASTVDVEDATVVMVGVLLGGPDHPTVKEAVRKLIASAALGFRHLQLVTAGEVFYTYSTPWKDTARAIATDDAAALVWSGTPVFRETEASAVRGGRPGTEVGSITVRVGPVTHKVPLGLDDEIADPGPWWRLTHPFSWQSTE